MIILTTVGFSIRGRFLAKLLRRTPQSDSSVVRGRDEGLGVNGVPCDTGNGPSVAAQDGNGSVTLDVEDVDLVVLTSGRNEVLVSSTETAVNGEETLLDTDELPDQAFFLNVPQVDALVGHVEDGVTVAVVEGKGHDAMILLQDMSVLELFQIVGPDSVVCICCQDGLAVATISQALDPHTFPRV